jgi:putative heme iron utilization protein
MDDKRIQDIRVENIEQFIELYPQLFSQKRLKEWQQLFNSEAVLVKIDVQGSNVVSIDEAMPEQEEYAAENDRFEEKWDNIRTNIYGNIAVVVADYILKVDNEIREGVDVVTLVHDIFGWKIVSLVYEQTKFITY